VKKHEATKRAFSQRQQILGEELSRLVIWVQLISGEPPWSGRAITGFVSFSR